MMSKKTGYDFDHALSERARSEKTLTLEQHNENVRLTEEMRRTRQAEAIVSGIEAAYKGEDGDTYAQEYGVWELTDTHITITLDGLVRILNEAKAEEQHDE